MERPLLPGFEEEGVDNRIVHHSSKDHATDLVDAAWPQAVAILCLLLVNMTSTAVLGQIGTVELAAVAFANVVLGISAVVLRQGFGDALVALVAQSVGSGNRKLAGIWLQTSLVVITVAALPVGVVWWYTGDLLALAGVSDEVRDLATSFARLSLPGLLPDVWFGAFAQWLNGQQLVQATLPWHLAAVAFNLVTSIILVHGVGSWGGMGFVGAPIATNCTIVLRGVGVWWWVVKVRRLHEPSWQPWTTASLSGTRLKTFLVQALPAGLAGLIEQAQFVVVTLMVSSLGETQVATHSGMLNVFSVLCFAMYALTDAGAAVVGKWLGAGRAVTARQAARMVLVLMLAMGAVIAVTFLLARNVVGKIFSMDPEVWYIAEELSVICGIAFLLLALAFGCFAVLQGQGRPGIAAGCMLLGLWGVSVPGAYVAEYTLQRGLPGVWIGLTCGYGISTLVMMCFVACSNWEQLAIEAQIRSEAHPDPLCTDTEDKPVLADRFISDAVPEAPVSPLISPYRPKLFNFLSANTF
jgi:MATE family multidrug resistance protein